MNVVIRQSETLVSHEWLASHGGSENVFEELIGAFPGARYACLWNDAPERFNQDVEETWLARTPLRRSKAASLPFHPAAWRSINLDGIARVISSSHALGHHLASRAADRGARAFVYAHTPARYVWTPEFDSRGAGWLQRLASSAIRPLDRGATRTTVSYAANSSFVAQRLESTWGVPSRVIYPPVQVKRLQSQARWKHELSPSDAAIFSATPSSFVLGASRIVDYKRLDLAIKVGEILDLPVVIAGDGPHRHALTDWASQRRVPVRFLGRVSDPLLWALYQEASLFVFMAVEDFGIMPIEAMSLGTPVLVNAQGGAAEGVSLIGGGVAVSPSASVDVVASAAREALDKDPKEMMQRARYFDSSRFVGDVRKWVDAP